MKGAYLKSILGALESSVLLMDVKEVRVNKSEHSNNTAAILRAQNIFMPTWHKKSPKRKEPHLRKRLHEIRL